MTPGEVLIQQQLAYETLAASTRMNPELSHPSPLPEQPPPIMKGLEVNKNTESSMKKKLSVREMEQEGSPHPERVNKKPRLSQDTSDFTPFRYQDSRYTDYTQG